MSLYCGYCHRLLFSRGEFYCRFSHDVTKFQTSELLILMWFYFHDVQEQLKTNIHTNFHMDWVLGLVIDCRHPRPNSSLWRGQMVRESPVSSNKSALYMQTSISPQHQRMWFCNIRSNDQKRLLKRSLKVKVLSGVCNEQIHHTLPWDASL